jgi:hypothetical protein
MTWTDCSLREIDSKNCESTPDTTRKLTWRYGRPLVLKSPPHTGRIRLQLEMFPRAKFVHIHRNPYAVYPSSRKTFRVNDLQDPRGDDEDWVLGQNRSMYEAFFEERELIPAGCYHEVGFERLEADPIGEIRRIHEALGLSDFGHVEPALRRYVDAIASYTKDAFPRCLTIYDAAASRSGGHATRSGATPNR